MLNQKEVAMGIVKVHRYGVRAHPLDARSLTLEAPGKPALRIAAPPDFRNGVRGTWSPEELLVGSLAACLELTVVAIAEYKEVPIHTIRIDATGHVERKDSQYRFVLIELDVELETDPGREREAERVVEVAHERCIVGSALEVPVHLSIAARGASMAGAAI
jgi:organic hydroperoxide reductase OsmC/OhrA